MQFAVGSFRLRRLYKTLESRILCFHSYLYRSGSGRMELIVQKGRVYWITGLPGSGKTTIGTALYYDLREIQDNVIILDGDILKYFVGDV